MACRLLTRLKAPTLLLGVFLLPDYTPFFSICQDGDKALSSPFSFKGLTKSKKIL